MTGTANDRGLLHRIGSIGDRPDDPAAVRLQHRFLVYMGVLMALGAAVWSALSLYFHLLVPGLIPLGYLLLTAANLAWFAHAKAFAPVRAVQISASVLLPFLFQWSVGGIQVSGAVMLWGLVAIVGALTFTTPRVMLTWLIAYLLLVVVSGLIDDEVRRRFEVTVTERVQIGFFVVNFTMISAIVIALMVWFLDQRQRARAELAQANAAIADLKQEVQQARRLGQYTLVEKLGQGGMGAVYRASHAMLRRPTAIKLIRADRADEATIARFEREVQTTATLTHPNTVKIYDYGRTEDGTFYYVMEYLDGADLGAVVRLGGKMALGRMVRVVLQIAESLAEAHARGLIHRDIKPANVLLTRGYANDVVKVVDFGLVKEVAPSKETSTATQRGVVTGTPAYMSPEALTRPDDSDARSDVYSLGCLAYFLITGEDVFGAGTTVEICGHHLHTTPVPMAVRAAREVPGALDALVLRCLAKRPEERPTTGELIAALRGWTGEPWSAWDDDAAAGWWREHAGAIDDHRKRHAQSLDETVVAPATGTTSDVVGRAETFPGRPSV